MSVCLTREQVLGLEAQVSLGRISLEIDPKLRSEDHNRNCWGGLPTKFGQQLTIWVTWGRGIISLTETEIHHHQDSTVHGTSPRINEASHALLLLVCHLSQWSRLPESDLWFCANGKIVTINSFRDAAYSVWAGDGLLHQQLSTHSESTFNQRF